MSKFDENVQIDETPDLGWLDSWAMELETKAKGFPYVSYPTYVCDPVRYDGLIVDGLDCEYDFDDTEILMGGEKSELLDELDSVLRSVFTGKKSPTKALASHWNDDTETMVIPSHRLTRESIMGDWSMSIETETLIHDCESPERDLRNELFARMFASNCMVMPENFDRVMALDSPLDFMDENVCIGSDETSVAVFDPLLVGKMMVGKTLNLSERKFLPVRTISQNDMAKNKAYCESQNR